MAIKTTGAEWKAFYTDPIAWPEEAHHEEVELTIDTVDLTSTAEVDLAAIPDVSEVVIRSGFVITGPDVTTLERHFRSWKARQQEITLVVSVPRDKAQAVKEAIRAAGGRIQG